MHTQTHQDILLVTGIGLPNNVITRVEIKILANAQHKYCDYKGWK